MIDIIKSSLFFGAVISLLSYEVGLQLKKKFKTAILNPLLISVIITIAVVLILDIDYDSYYEGAKYISYFLTPATVCLAISLYEKLSLLKKNPLAIFGGILSGALASMTSIFLMSLLFGLSRKEYVTLLPKSITTAIGMGVSEELGGYVSVTAAVIIITGIIGNVFADIVFKIFKIKEPVAKGVALGTASHAIGTSKAMEMGETEGAMGSLSIVTSGLITVIFASLFSMLIK
jgi:predicted murein hydrolase (TIGR00659 family)